MLQAFNEGQIDLKRYKAMMSMLKAMAANLGKSGSLVEKVSDQSSGGSGQAVGNRKQAMVNSGQGARGQDAASEEPFEFSPETMAKLEEVEGLDMSDPRNADLIRTAVAEGLQEMKAHGFDVKGI